MVLSNKPVLYKTSVCLLLLELFLNMTLFFENLKEQDCID